MPQLSRRTFLFSLAAAGVRFCGAGVRPTGPARLRFGVLSDTHVTDDPKSAESLRRILRRFAQENVDAVVHAGDIRHIGTTTEFAHVLAAWRGAFPNGKNAKPGKPLVSDKRQLQNLHSPVDATPSSRRGNMV